MHEIVRARFRGPAINLRTGAKSLTIGPNHPMLTRRGFVKARDVREGDELLYDLRTEMPTADGVGSDNLEQMPFAEDIFSALAFVSGSLSRVARPHHDLHGDAVSCEGKVEVVHPARQLLPILDPCGIEQFSELAFPFADAGLGFIAALRASQPSSEAVLLAATGDLGAGGLEGALLDRHAGPFDQFLFGLGSGNDAVLFDDARDNAASGVVPLRQGEDALASFVARNNRAFRWDVVLESHVIPRQTP